MSPSLTQAQDVKDFLWATYDPNDDLIYPTVTNWAKLLKQTIAYDSFDKLSKEEVLSILFGVIHHTRIVEGAWSGLFEHGVAQKLLTRLIQIDTDKSE